MEIQSSPWFQNSSAIPIRELTGFCLSDVEVQRGTINNFVHASALSTITRALSTTTYGHMIEGRLEMSPFLFPVERYGRFYLDKLNKTKYA